MSERRGEWLLAGLEALVADLADVPDEEVAALLREGVPRSLTLFRGVGSVSQAALAPDGGQGCQ